MAGMTTKRLWVCAGALSLFSACPAAAQHDWIGTAGTLFFDTPENWNPLGPPNSDVDASMGTVDVAGSPIIIGASSSANGFDIFNNDWEFTGAAGGTLGTGTVTINDPTGTTLADGTNVLASNNLTWDTGSPVYVGTTGFGGLTLTGGSDFLLRQLFVGDGPTGVGQVTLTGTGTLVRANLNDNTGVFTIGRGGGTGTINVLDDADLRTNSTGANDIWVGGHTSDNAAANPVITSTGTLNVDGVGSFAETEDLQVGLAGGTGFLNITNGGNVTLTDGGSPDAIFASNGANGAVGQGFGVVDGDGSLLSARAIFIGNSGIATLTVSNGGEARTRLDSSTPSDIFIGNSLGSAGKAAVFGFATDGTTASLMDSEDNLIVGNEGLGELNVGFNLTNAPVGSGALQVDGTLTIGNVDGNDLDNTLRVHGPDTSVNVGVDLIVGNAGRGVYQQSGGATVTVGNDLTIALRDGSDSTATIDGAGTTLVADNLFAGNGTGGGSTASLTVSNGAVVTFTDPTPAGGTPAVGTITLGDDGNGEGTLTVTGAGSLVQTTNANGQWFIGGSGNETGGTGVANILAGGQGVAGGRTVLGWGSGASGTLNVDGPGSVFDANGDYILVGFNGTGQMNVTNGAVVNANRVFVADAAGSAGSTLTIDGPGSVVNIARLLYVGDTNAGTLNVTNGGQLNVATQVASERLIIGDEGGADGSKLTIDGTGSRVDYFGTVDVSVGNAGGSSANRATLEVTNGGVFSAVQRDTNNDIVTQARIIVGDVDGSNGYVKVDGPGSRVEASVMYVGDGNTNSTGVLDVTNGGVVDLTGEFQGGSFGSGQGTINIVGPGSQLLVGSSFSLGDDTLGGTSDGATGIMTVSNGGYVSSGAQAYVGHFTSSFGTATLESNTANPSVWDIGGELTLAGTESSSSLSGNGILNLNTGGVVNIASNLRVRNLGDVNLSGGTLNIGGDLVLTDPGSTINFAFGKIGFTDPAGTTLSPNELERLLALGGGNRPTLFTNMELAIAGTANLGGPLRINGGTLTVGALTPASFVQLDFDAGTFNLTDSGLPINASGPLGKDVTIGASQTLNVGQTVSVFNGSSLTVVGGFSAGALEVAGAVTFIDATPGTKVVGGLVRGIGNGTLTVVGDVQFNGAILDIDRFYGPGNVIIGGDYAPGASPAQVQFDGGFGVATTGVVEIEIGGTTPGSEYDQLVIAGDADLGGTLELVLIDGFTPTLGQSFTVLTSAGLNGTSFDAVVGSLIGSGLALEVGYTTTDVVLSVVDAALPGDTDGDGDIDDSDLGTSFANYTGPVGAAGNKTAAQGDTDGDGDVDDSDLGTSFSGYTGPLGPIAAGNVPEPASLITLAGLLGWVTRRRR
ncbi:MAG: beta strand repeat-containing protein [Phycisphaeraceae bacterium]